MKRSIWIPAALLTLTGLYLAPLTPSTYASQRYRSYGYRSSHYRYRPAYRGHTYRYRPYYGYGLPALCHARTGALIIGPMCWPWLGFSWGYPAPYAFGVSVVVCRQRELHLGWRCALLLPGSVRPARSIRRQTEIYVDGYYAGIVDDFDGTFQRLYMPPGQHEIVLRHRRLPNSPAEPSRQFRTEPVKLHHEMKPLGPGEKTPPPPEPPKGEPAPAEEETTQPHRDGEDEPPATREEFSIPVSRNATPTQEQAPRQLRSLRPPGRFGLLALRSQPADAQVFIDGELWGSLAGLDGLSIHLPTGRHRLEVRKEGFRALRH